MRQQLKDTLTRVSVYLTIFLIAALIYRIIDPYLYPGLENRILFVLVPSAIVLLYLYLDEKDNRDRLFSVIMVIIGKLRESKFMRICKRIWRLTPSLIRTRVSKVLDELNPYLHKISGYMLKQDPKEVVSYVFLGMLLIVALQSIFPQPSFEWARTPMMIAAVVLGVITFHLNRGKLGEIEDEARQEKLEENLRMMEFAGKYPRINRVWGVRWIVRWMYKEGWAFTIPLIIISIVFLAIKIGMPIVYTGSYIDEYNHIFSGIEFFNSGHFAEIYHGSYYERGAYVSVLVGLFMHLFGETIFVAKMLPATIGVINFFLLFNISKRMFENKIYVLLVLVVYTTIPWFIFNHFYVRHYVFYEFFILFLTLIFMLMIINITNIKKVASYSVLALTILLIVHILSNDSGKCMILLYSGFFLTYIFFFQTQKIPINTRFYKFISSNYIFKFVFFALIFGIIFISIGYFYLFERLTSGTISYTSASDHKYDHLFFNLNTIFTLFFLISSNLLFLKRNNIANKLVIFSSLCLFFIHYNSSLDLQITRAIIYFLPLFYLCSILSVSKYLSIYKNKRIAIFVILLLTLNIYTNYPDDFFSGPNIPTEINYVEYKEVSRFLNEECSNKTIFVLIPNPYILTFYDVNVDYTSYIRKSYLENDNKFYFENNSSSYRTSYKHIPAINDRNKLITKIDGNSCVVISEKSTDHWRYFEEKDIQILENKFSKNQFGNDNVINIFCSF